MKKKVTLKDIAKKIGVDTSTVSKALRSSPDISVDMQNKIKDVADKICYRPNLLAKSLISSRSNMIGALIPDLRISFFSEATRGIYETAAKNGFESILLVHDENPQNEKRKLEFLSDINVDGILLNPVDETTNLMLYKKLLSEGIKIVCWDRKIRRSKFNSITIDDRIASFELTDNLIKAGRRKILYIGPTRGIHIFEDRFEGYRDALKVNNIRAKKNLLIETERTYKSSYERLNLAIQKGIDFDAIICAGGVIAFAAGNAILENGLNIPDDILLGEFGDNHIISRLGIPFYTVNQNPYAMGCRAVDLLTKQIYNDKVESKHLHIDVEHKIILRNPGIQKISIDN